MKNTVEYTFDNYPNVKVVAYKGADGTLETNIDKFYLIQQWVRISMDTLR